MSETFKSVQEQEDQFRKEIRAWLHLRKKSSRDEDLLSERLDQVQKMADGFPLGANSRREGGAS